MCQNVALVLSFPHTLLLYGVQHFSYRIEDLILNTSHDIHNVIITLTILTYPTAEIFFATSVPRSV